MPEISRFLGSLSGSGSHLGFRALFSESGLILENEDGMRFGAWLLPDNQSRGMMETFLSLLVPSQHQQVWEHAIQATDQARGMGAPSYSRESLTL